LYLLHSFLLENAYIDKLQYIHARKKFIEFNR
jgi:hypothetical protein